MKSWGTYELISYTIKFKNIALVELSMVMGGILKQVVMSFDRNEMSLR